ncbi:5-bromo-4-chloroindolyl phosphate hydrolysis family protein [Aerococcus kribbianus]|uniref:5-bromo-4-chloroindolyl phosphate hydrolysis family protein n=1 Tax=Aerococcus kribbianus TaxID=2999064 RepID=A0A9X3FNT0_9LACT|nr:MULTISPECIES: 5-bromo-4-chloroindolyl phosphate hydrolysis family protein [unclassified Aerococcus]MCZ0717699.1 5-bromo-4-chloroindolyl phosphate hydrolysis family protein [Aerococcus sp. YH-aer221]MCZ0725987.1 5-bromo-4-chloroindolyl phosphate hydrolysis family protein [Aerococcus sp. YH-aer222]
MMKQNPLIIGVGIIAGLAFLGAVHQESLIGMVLAISGFTLALFYYFYRQKDSLAQKPTLDNNKLTHYRSHGLSDHDINFFRQEMQKTTQSIHQIMTEVNQDRHLKMLFSRHNGIALLQNFCQALIQQPERLSDASTYIYKDLPDLRAELIHYHQIDSKTMSYYDCVIAKRQSKQRINQYLSDIAEAYNYFNRKESQNDQ